MLGAVLIAAAVAGCSDDEGSASGLPSIERQAAEYQIPTDEPGTPDPSLADHINISDRLPGFSLNVNQVTSLVYDTERNNAILSGREVFTETKYVKSQVLRVDRFAEPPDAKIVQVEVSLDGPAPLKSRRETEKGVFAPGPLLGDELGNFYWPVGYVLINRSGDPYYEVQLDPANPMKDLRDMPALSTARPQDLYLIFRVNEGVTLNSYSYGGNEKRTFSLPVSDRR